MKRNRNRGPAVLLLLLVCAGLVFALRSGSKTEIPDNRMPTDSDADRFVADAERRAESGDGHQARQLISDALRLDPNNGKALLYRAMFQHEDGQASDALGTLAQITDDAGLTAATARHLEGRILLDQKQARRAEGAFLRSLELNPRYTAPLKYLAGLYSLQLRNRELDSVLKRLRQAGAVSLEYESLELLNGRPIVEESQATEILEQYLASDPDDVRSLVALLKYELIGSRIAQAKARLDARSGQSNSAADEELRGIVGLIDLADGDPESAEQQLAGMSFSEATPTASWDLRGRLAAQHGDWETARQVFVYLTEQLPFDIAVRHRLATACERLGMSDAANRVHQQAAELDQLERLAYTVRLPRAPNSPPQQLIPVLFEISEILEKLDRSPDAMRWALMTAQLSPQDAALQQRVLVLRAKVTSASEQAGQSHPAPPLPPLQPEPEESKTATSEITENVRQAQFPTIRFSDEAESMGLRFQYFNGQSPEKRIVETVGGGAGILDCDLDGWPDLYFPQGAESQSGSSTSNRRNDCLFRNRMGVRFEDITDVAGIDEPLHSLSCTIGDLDNDGFADVLVTNIGVEVLFRNQGDGTFRKETPEVLQTHNDCSSAAACVDFNGDGLPDLFVVNYVTGWDRVCQNSRGEFATCDPREFSGGPDRVYLNDGLGGFTDVSQTAGLAAVPGKGLGIVVADFDDDGRPDVYVANDGMPNFLYRNRSAEGQLRFEESGMQSGVAVNGDGRSEAGMGIACADFDASGTLDLFVTNFYRETNTLYLNLGGAYFEDRTRAAGLDVASRDVLGFGTKAVDIDLNGTADLLVLNGDIDDYSSDGRPWKMKPQVFRNRGNAEFEDVSSDAGSYFAVPALGRGLVRADMDGDGRPDLVAVHHDHPAAMLMNRTVPVRPSVSVCLNSTFGARDAVGAILRISEAGRPAVFSVNSGDGFASSDERRLVIPMPAASSEISIRWPGGAWQPLAMGVPSARTVVIQDSREATLRRIYAIPR